MAQGNAQDDIAKWVKVPLFRGGQAKTDTLTTLAWCESVDRQKVQQDWNNARTAVAAIDSFREHAAEWFRVVREEKPDSVDSWATLRPLVIARFGPSKTPAQRVAMLSNLKQNGTESTETFYDRVAGAYYEVLRPTMAALTGDNADHETVGFKVARDELLKLTFVAGLRQNVREGVEARMTAASDLAWIREAATATEVATHSRKITPYAAVVSTEIPRSDSTAQKPTPSPRSAISTNSSQQGGNFAMRDIQTLIRNELAAFRTPGPSSGGRAAPAQQRQWEADPSKPKAPTVTEATKRLGPMGERGWIYCSRCCQWGLHIRPECTWSMDRIRSIPKMDQSARPSGAPSDRQYPNV